MTRPPIQADFGGFNPRFHGITVKLNSVREYRLWRDFLSGASPTNTKTKALTAIAVTSVLDHEFRHYHDFLLSPYSSFVFRMHLQGVIAGLQALSDLRRVPGTCLPVPLSRWIVMPDEKRSENLSEWSAMVPPPDPGGWRSISLPVRSEQALLGPLPGGTVDIRNLSDEQRFSLQAETAVRSYLRIRQLIRGATTSTEHPELRPSNVFEATALTAQVASIYQSQGLAEATDFLQYLLGSKLGYALVWQKFLRAAILIETQREGVPDDPSVVFDAVPRILAMALWCLLGNYQLEGDNACPTIRFVRLMWLIAEDYSNSHNRHPDVGETWDHWDRLSGVQPWRLAVEKMIALNKSGLQAYERLKAQWSGDDAIPALAERLMRIHLSEQETMVGHLLMEPLDLADPHRYLNVRQGEFSVPCLKVELDGFAIPLSELSEPHFRSLWNIDRNGELYTTRFTVFSAARKDELDDFISGENLMFRSDLVFSDHPIPWEVSWTMRSDLERLVNKRILLIV